MRIAILLALCFCVEPILCSEPPHTAAVRFFKKKKKKKIKKEVQQPLFPVQRETPLYLTTSVIIPCNQKQFGGLKAVLRSYEKQTIPPNEVIVALAQFESLPVLEVLAVERLPLPFPVTVIKLGGKKTTGWLLNCAANQATGDILLCQESNVLAHPQRVEVVKALFENYYVDCLLHEGIAEEMTTYEDLTALSLQRHGSYKAVKERGIAVNAGNICIAKQVAINAKWNEEDNVDQDAQFSEKVYQQFKNNLTVQAKLLLSKGL